MNFEKGGMNKESLIRKVPRIRFFDSLSSSRDFPKSCLNATFQMVINETNPGLCSVFHIEALGRGNILARYVQFCVTDTFNSL